ncbi:MAG: hypothetical protein H0T62_14175 [Parachlamydiaceae bacterium]|nr:hypothetical protein [Parachlamydiaceae bacterium]
MSYKPGDYSSIINPSQNQLDPILNHDTLNIVISCLNRRNLRSVSLVSTIWYKAVAISILHKDFAITKKVISIFSRNLKKDLYGEQKQKIKNLVNQKIIDLNLPILQLKENYLISKKDIKENVIKVLSSLPNDEFALIYKSFFTEFYKVQKPQVFYDLIFSSEKYKNLHKQLNNFI